MDIELLGQIKDVLDNEERAQTEDARRENYTIFYSDDNVTRNPTVTEVVMALCNGFEVEIIDKKLGGIK